MTWDDRRVRGLIVAVVMAGWTLGFAAINEISKAASIAEEAYAKAEAAQQAAEDAEHTADKAKRSAERRRSRRWWPFS